MDQSSAEKKYLSQLKKIRRSIDQADRLLLSALAQRTSAVTRLARLKFINRTPIQQKSRWKQLIVDRLGQAKILGVDRQLTEKIFNEIQRESIRRQKALMGLWTKKNKT